MGENHAKHGDSMADRLEKKGIPGKSILTEYMDLMRAANQPILRQWDKE